MDDQTREERRKDREAAERERGLAAATELLRRLEAELRASGAPEADIRRLAAAALKRHLTETAAAAMAATPTERLVAEMRAALRRSGSLPVIEG